VKAVERLHEKGLLQLKQCSKPKAVQRLQMKIPVRLRLVPSVGLPS